MSCLSVLLAHQLPSLMSPFLSQLPGDSKKHDSFPQWRGSWLSLPSSAGCELRFGSDCSRSTEIIFLIMSSSHAASDVASLLYLSNHQDTPNHHLTLKMLIFKWFSLVGDNDGNRVLSDVFLCAHDCPISFPRVFPFPPLIPIFPLLSGSPFLIKTFHI